jgi:hypothetical protein
MEDVVSVDNNSILEQARANRNNALDQAELNAALVVALRKERGELKARIRELEEAANG